MRKCFLILQFSNVKSDHPPDSVNYAEKKIHPYDFVIRYELYSRGSNALQKGPVRHEKLMYDKESVYPGDGKEYSPEELRLKRLLERKSTPNPQFGSINVDIEEEESDALSKTVGNGPPISRNSSALDSYYDDTAQLSIITSRHKNALNEVIGFFNKNDDEEDALDREEVTRGRLIIPSNDDHFEVFQENDDDTQFKSGTDFVFEDDLNIDDFNSRRDSDLTSFSLPKSFDAYDVTEFTETQNFKDIASQFRPKTLELSERPMIFAAQFKRSANNVYDPFELFDGGYALQEAITSTGLENDDNVYLYEGMPPKFGPGDTITFGKQNFYVQRKIIEDVQGEPSPCFLVQDKQTKVFYVLKKSTLWDYYISKRIQHKLPDKDRKYFIEYDTLHMFEDITFITYKYEERISMPFSDFIHHQRNSASSESGRSKSSVENICIYYTMQMIRMILTLHEYGFIGGGLSPSSFYVASGSSEFTEFKPQTDSWNRFGLYMKDYSSVIDTEAFPEGACFTSEVNSLTYTIKQSDKGLLPWMYDVDLYSVCDLAHILLYEKGISLIRESSGRWRTKETPKVYWERELWLALFDMLLNIGVADQKTSLVVGRQIMELFESYLLDRYGNIAAIKLELSKLLNNQND